MRLKRRALLASAVTLFAALPAWALGEPHFLITRRLRIASRFWPAAYPTLRIAVIADPHVGSPGVGLDDVTMIVERANAEAPDLIVLLGDYVNRENVAGTLIPPEPIAERLAQLRAPFGTFAILGNHDWGFDGERVWRSLERAGIPVLENDARPLDLASRRFWLGALADDTTRQPDMKPIAALAGADPLVLLAHDPGSFLEVPAGPALLLAGHTHGGQIRLPFVGAFYVPSRAPLAWSYGHISDQGREIYVSAGIGTTTLPVRLNAPPEIVIIDLAAAPGQTK